MADELSYTINVGGFQYFILYNVRDPTAKVNITDESGNQWSENFTSAIIDEKNYKARELFEILRNNHKIYSPTYGLKPSAPNRPLFIHIRGGLYDDDYLTIPHVPFGQMPKKSQLVNRLTSIAAQLQILQRQVADLRDKCM